MKSNLSLFLRILLGIIIIVIFFVFWEEIKNLKIEQLIKDNDDQLTAIMIIIGLFLLKSIFFFIPAILIFISTGIVLPTHLAIIVCTLAVFFEISLTYFYGYFLGENFVEKLMNKLNTKNMIKSRWDNELLIIFFLRLSPMAIEPVSLLIGANHYKFWEYIGASIMGLLPKIILFIMIGDTFKNNVTFVTVFTFIIFISIWFIGTFYLKKNYLDT
jgi:uncharacterized membrane protein YdjX (TVP38/TMEM64 family)